ncbi:hypothetical protein O3M35_013320 [Rhynocoris fuscipes]|uniref:Uncharacterized protein n=1 Tax=Rhynocoris fuscipes TaxID=488301 RepID=A0AAW1CED6_9HEMI
MEKISDAQGNIASLLTRISQALELQRQMPAENSPNALRALNSEVDARRDQIRDLDGLKSNVEKLRLDLMSQKVHLARVRDGGKAQLGRLSSLYEEDRKKLQENTIHSSLASQEQKLRALWQSTFTLEDFVRLK